MPHSYPSATSLTSSLNRFKEIIEPIVEPFGINSNRVFANSFIFLSIFEKLNLKVIKTYGDYKLNPFNKESSPRLIMVIKIL